MELDLKVLRKERSKHFKNRKIFRKNAYCFKKFEQIKFLKFNSLNTRKWTEDSASELEE